MAERYKLASWEEEGNRHVGLIHRPVAARHRVIAEALASRLGAGPHVLDFGCGLGQTSEVLQSLRPDVEITFADPYQACLDVTARHVRGTALQVSEAAFVPEEIPDGLDGIIASHVLEHSMHPVGMALGLLDALRPGGFLVLAVPNPVRPKVMWSSLRQRNYANRGHVVCWDPAHWRNFLEVSLGADVVEYPVDEVQVVPPRVRHRLPILRRLEAGLGVVLPWWSFSNIAVVRAHGTVRGTQ